MTLFENLSTGQKVRAALHRDVTSICTEACSYLGLSIARPATAIIAELVFRKISVYGLDLEAFAKHAKRSTINQEDVKLLARRNSSLRAHLIAMRETPSAKVKRRKSVLPVANKEITARKDSDEEIQIPNKKPKIITDEKDDVMPPGPSINPENIIEDVIDLTLDS